MKYLHAVLLLYRSDKPITEKNLIKVLSSVGIEADLSKVKVLVDTMDGVDIEKALKTKRLVKVPVKAKFKQIMEKPKEKKKEEETGLGKLFG